MEKVKSDEQVVLTAEDISQILQVSKPKAYEIMRDETFPLIELGRCKRVLKDDFFNWLSKNKNTPLY